MSAEQDGVGQDGPRAGTPGAERDRVATPGHLEDGLRQAGVWYPYEIDVEGVRAAIGAAPQAGWTALIADAIRRRRGDAQTVGDILRLYGRQAQR